MCVKSAYLQMNASGILDRLRTVSDKISELHTVLTGADPVIVNGGKCMMLKATGEEGVDEGTDDPNSICCPQLSDFDVTE